MWLCEPAAPDAAASASPVGSLFRSSPTTPGASAGGTRAARARELATLARKCGLPAERITRGTNAAVVGVVVLEGPCGAMRACVEGGQGWAN